MTNKGITLRVLNKMYQKVREYVKFLLPYKWTHYVRVRSHYFINPHLIDQKVERMFKMNTSDINLENVFYTTEMDRRGGDNYYTVGVKNINHLNLLIGAMIFQKKGSQSLWIYPKVKDI